MKTVEKIFISLITIIGFIPLIAFCSVVIEQSIAEVDYLAVVVLTALATMLLALAVVIIIISLGGDNDENSRKE
jgi:hypothetical protein